MSKQPKHDGAHIARFLYAIMGNIAGSAAQGAAYESWPDEFARSECRDGWTGDGRGWGQKLTVEQPRAIPDADRRNLGFSKWDDEGGLVLIPLWAFNVVADGEELTSISGDRVVKGRDEIDLDVRFGCTAFGFHLEGQP